MKSENAQLIGIDSTNGSANHLILTPQRMKQFLDWQRSRNRSDVTIKRYEKDLEQLFAWLPDDKIVTAERIGDWKRNLVKKGYAGSSINSKLSAVNSYLTFEGRRDLQVLNFEVKNDVNPLLSRTEYIRLLQAARSLSDQRVYLMIKVFGSMGISVQLLEKFTIEAIEQGSIKTEDEIYMIPSSLQNELKEYASVTGVKSGPVFIGSSGHPLKRTTVTNMMKRLDTQAQVEKEKITPRCLKKMYLNTIAEVHEGVEYLVEKAYKEILEREQMMIGWEQTDRFEDMN